MATLIRLRPLPWVATCALPFMWGGAVLAQSPATAPTQPTDPSAASSPHQRDAVKAPGAEAPASADPANASDASTPHQKQVMKKKKHHAKPPADGTPPP